MEVQLSFGVTSEIIDQYLLEGHKINKGMREENYLAITKFLGRSLLTSGKHMSINFQAELGN